MHQFHFRVRKKDLTVSDDYDKSSNFLALICMYEYSALISIICALILGPRPMITHESGLTFAGENVREGLFKFRCCGTKKGLERVKNILRGKLYFSTCKQLNDPFEFRVRLQVEPSKKKRLSGLHRAMKDSHVMPKMSPAKRLEKAGQMANRLERNRNVLEKAARKHYERMKSECFIFCVSATRLHPLLWSHYADKHRGVCIQLDHKLTPLAVAAKVDYSCKYPVVTYPFKNLSDLAVKGILTKAEYWQYEEEYRLFSIRSEDNDAWDLGLEWLDDHTAVVSPKCVVGITLGARMPEPQRKALVAYCAENHPEISIEQANICNDRFAIAID